MDVTHTEVLTDEMWARIEPLLPALKGPMDRTLRPHRPLVEGSILRLPTGFAVAGLPAEFGPWQTVWMRRAKFSKDGSWDEVLLALQAQADANGEIDWNVSVDSTVARVHQHGATAARSVLKATALAQGARLNRWVAGTNRTITPYRLEHPAEEAAHELTAVGGAERLDHLEQGRIV